MTQEQVQSTIKDTQLIKKRREQMIQGAIKLFKEKGFHRTTTREIAKESGFSIGTLYEYIRTKEDVLFLVCDSIYEQVHQHFDATIELNQPSIQSLVVIVKAYFQLMDDMQEEVLILYQEVKSLTDDSKDYVLQKELAMVKRLARMIKTCAPTGITDQDATLIANNIFVQGQMWGFRRWALHQQFTLEEYTERQVHYLMHALSMKSAHLK